MSGPRVEPCDIICKYVEEPFYVFKKLKKGLFLIFYTNFAS